MEALPAIDLRGGQAVRLLRGDYDAETVYDADPVARAVGFADAGAEWIHVVDLDAARTGEAANLDVVRAICAAVDCRVQTGGGVRDEAAAQRLLDAGAARVVVGTAAVENPDRPPGRRCPRTRRRGPRRPRRRGGRARLD